MEFYNEHRGDRRRVIMAFSRLRWGAVLAIPAVLIGIGLVLWLRSPVPRTPIHVTYPQEGTLFPNDIVPPTFRWEDPSGAKQWRITFEFSDGGARDHRGFRYTLMAALERSMGFHKETVP